MKTRASNPGGGGAAARLLAAACLLAVGAWAAGCGREKPAPGGGEPAPAPSEGQVWVRHILIQYAGAQGAPAAIHRPRASADSLARALHAQLVNGGNFGALARQHSDDASAPDGGEIEALKPGETPAEFERVANSLQPGQLSPVFESPYGFHIVERRDMETIAAQHILIRYRGAKSCPDSIARSRDQALALAQKIREKLDNPQASFPIAAMLYSEDERTAYRGGFLGSFQRGKMEPAFEKAAFALKDGQVSAVVETPFGFHIIKRVKDENIRVCHILVTFVGADQPEERRTRDQALARARDVLFRARKGEDFGALAKEYSEDRLTAKKGGRMPPLSRGNAVPEFEEAAFSLQPGQVSDIVETKYGFHVIKRLY